MASALRRLFRPGRADGLVPDLVIRPDGKPGTAGPEGEAGRPTLRGLRLRIVAVGHRRAPRGRVACGPRRIAGAAPPRTRRDGPDMLQPSRKQNEATATATAASVPGRAWLMPALVTVGCAVDFWAWALFSPLGPRLKDTLHLTAFQQSLLVAVPVVVGSLGRIPVGALTDRFGGRVMFPLVSAATVVPVLHLGLARAGRDARRPEPSPCADPFLGGDSDRPTARVRRPDRPRPLPSRSPWGAVDPCRWVGHAGGGRCEGIGERLWWMSVVRGPVMPGCPRLCRSYVWMSCWRVCSGRWRRCGRRVTVFIRCWMRCW